MSNQSNQPSELELQILGVIWDRGPSTARDVLEAMPDGKRRAYTSILSVMQVMERKGLLGREADRQGRAIVFRATMQREQVTGPLLKGLLSRVFGGRPTMAIQHLLDEADVSEADLAEIQRLLDERKERS